MQKISLLALLALMTTTSYARNLGFTIPSYQEVIDEIFIKTDREKSLEDFLNYKKEAELKYPHLNYGIYQGVSSAKTTSAERVNCFSLIAIDLKTKKIRDFRIVSNIKKGPLATAGSEVASTSRKLIGKILPQLTSGVDVELDAENEKNDWQNTDYALASKYEEIIPKNFEQDKELRKALENSSGLNPYFNFTYKPATSLFSKNSSSAIEAGVNAVGINYNVVNLEVILDKDIVPSELRLTGGVGMGFSLEMSCKNLKKINSAEETDKSTNENEKEQKELTTTDKVKNVMSDGLDKIKSYWK